MSRLLFGVAFTALVVSSSASAQRSLVVKQGQTLSAIARRHGVDVWDLALANDMRPDSRLRAGQGLVVPPRGVTYVRPGQTLSHIARAHHCSVDQLKRINGIRNDGKLRAGSRLRLPGYVAQETKTRDWGEPEQPGVVRLSRHDRRQELELVADGRVRLKGLRQLAQLMRRQEDDEARSLHPRLALLLAKISDHFGGRELRIVSGFREAGGYTREGSRHLQGRAADIQILGVPRRLIWDYCRSLAQTGCGYYPNSVFVHVDVREHPGQWVDWSYPGKRPRYGTLRRPYRKRERKNKNRPREGRNITRRDEVALVVEVIDRHDAVVRVFDERPAPGELPPDDGDEDALDAADGAEDDFAGDANAADDALSSAPDGPLGG